MAVETAQSFLEVLEKSKLLNGDQFAVAREAAGQAADARTLARTLIQKELLTRWQAAQLLAGRSAFQWGKYKFVDLLGRGGMGSVFLAWHTMMNRPVALKIIARRSGQDPAALERFFTEARAVAALDHPNIVHAYDVANEGDRYYLVMEYVEGRDLQRMVEADGSLDFALAVDYVRQAADGLAHAHSKDMVHCDIKPANLLVNRQGIVKILDMGMARAVGRKPQINGPESSGKDSQALVGTVDYMAPEQAMGDENLDPRVDIYSLGCTFYFLLTGHPPFPEGTLAQRIVKHQTQEPKEIAEERPETPGELIRICQKMMAKEPDGRFQTANEVSEVLANWRPVQTKILRATPLEETEERGKESPDKGPAGEAEPAKGSKIKTKIKTLVNRVKTLVNRVVDRSRQWIAGTMADRRRMMIAGGVSIVISVLLMAGMIGWALSSAKARRVRVAAEVAAKDQAKAEVARKQSEFDGLPLAIDEPPGEPSTSTAAPAKTGLPPGPPGKAGPPPLPGAPPPLPGAKAVPAPGAKTPPPAPGKAAAGATPANPAPAASTPAAPATPGGAAAQAAKTPAAAAPATPAPAKTETPAPATPAPATAPAKAAPATPAPAAASPAPAAAGDLLQEFPKVAELPPIGESDNGEFPSGPTLLGKINGSLDQPVTIELVGKDTALKGRRQFTWEAKETNDKKPGWVAQIETGGKEEAKIDVAHLWRDKRGLLFKWAGGAAEAKRECECLRNCALELRGGGPPHVVPLRKPAQVKPILFDLQRGVSTGTVPIEFLPDAANLRVEITKVEGREGYIVEPAGPLALKTPALLRYVRKDRRGQLRPGVDFSVTVIAKGKGLAITIKLVSPPAPQYKAFLAMVQAERPNLELKARELGGQFAAAKEEADKGKVADKLEQCENPLWFDDFYQQVNRKARLHFRVFIDAKDQKIELARSEMPK